MTRPADNFSSCGGRGRTDIRNEVSNCEIGFVTYTNEAKTQMLGVDAALFTQVGAVSEEVADEMARGALANSDAHISLSTTGIAGPAGAVPGKPVGTVCFGWAVAWEQVLGSESLEHFRYISRHG